MGRRGPKKWELPETDLKTLESMAAVGISLQQMAKIHGISEETLSNRYGDRIENARSKAVASVGGALYRKAMAGNVPCMIFYLKTQGRWREVDRLEVTGKDGKEIKVSVEWVKKSG